MPILKPALKMANLFRPAAVRSVDPFWDEPDPFTGVRVTPCPMAKTSPSQRGPIIQVNAQGEPLSTGIVWPGAQYADGARTATAESPLRQSSAPPRRSCHLSTPLPIGPVVALGPRLDEGTGEVAGKPWTATHVQHPPLILPRSPMSRARSAGPPPKPGSMEGIALEAQQREWRHHAAKPPLRCAAPPPLQEAPPPCAARQRAAPPPVPIGPRQLATPVPARAPRGEPLPSGKPLSSGDPLLASPQATGKNCGGFAWQPKGDNGVVLVEIAASSSSASPPPRPRSKSRAKKKPWKATQEETKEVPEWRMPSRTNPPPLGMHPTDDYLAWHRLNFGPESDAQVQLSRMPADWTPDAEYLAWRQQAFNLESETPDWEPDWGSSEWQSPWDSWTHDAQHNSTEWSPGQMPTAWAPDCDHIPAAWEPDWNPPWDSWASVAECCLPEREPVCPSTQGQPAVCPLPNSYGPLYDRRTPNNKADGRRVKRPRGGARERSHNGYYRRPSGA